MSAQRRAARSRVNSRAARNRQRRREAVEGREGFMARQERMTGYVRYQNTGGSA